MQNIKVSELKKHPRNEEFFDDIYGEKWESFIESVKRRGIIEPIVVTQDLVIVSGHQRVRACEEIGILEIPCRITHYPDYNEKLNKTKEDMILEDLISTNIMQRGVGNVNPMKMAKCVQELERIKGVRQGGFRGNQYTKNQNKKYSQSDLANEIGLKSRQIRRYKELLKLIPELQDMVENESIKASVGYNVWARMSSDEQEKFFNDIGREKIKTLTQRETQRYIDMIKGFKKDVKLSSGLKRKSISKSIENHLIARSKGHCEICGYGDLDMISLLEKHHIKPVSEGGQDELENLIMICPNCHKTIHILRNEKENSIKDNILKHLNSHINSKMKLYI
ncbi:TPA: ParB N-terminal domain-containing protein [Clostridium perfringens]|nr:ParB N-terminal domain-containing protein [Clostridium perfringens]